MTKWIPKEIDDYFLTDILLIWLMVNYSMPLANLYLGLVIVGSIMYYVAVDSRFFVPLPFVKDKKNMLTGIIVGIALGVGFIWFYNMLQTEMSITQVFTTTAFGSSVILGMLVFGPMVGFVETRFFFRTTMQWGAWKYRIPIGKPFSAGGIGLMVFFAGIFTIFHATAKGVSNNVDLIATFIFGAISIGVILYTGQWIEAAVMHITVNSVGVGFFAKLMEFYANGALLTNPWVLASVGVVIFYYVSTKKKVRIPFIS